MSPAINLFKLIFHAFNGIFKVFGLLPVIRYNKSRLNVICFYIYSMVCLSFMIHYYEDWSFVANANIKFVSSLTILYSKSLQFTSITLLVLVYFFQHLSCMKRLKIEETIEGFLVALNGKCFFDHRKAQKQIICFAATVIITNIPYEITLFVKNYNSGTQNLFLAAVYIVPSALITLLIDYYCGCMLLSAFYFKQINSSVAIIIGRIKGLLRKVHTLGYDKKNKFMQEFCNLSDQLDEMAVFHKKLSVITLRYNEMWSNLTLLFVIWRFFLLTTQLYIDFIIIKLAIKYGRSAWDIQIITMFLMFTYTSSLLKVAVCCRKVMSEVICSPMYLHTEKKIVSNKQVLNYVIANIQ